MLAQVAPQVQVVQVVHGPAVRKAPRAPPLSEALFMQAELLDITPVLQS